MERDRRKTRKISPRNDELITAAVAALRRASDTMLASEARHYFVPRGTRVRVDMNRVLSFLFESLADGIERRRARKAH